MGVALALLPLLLAAGPQKIAVLDVRAREGVTAGLVQIITDAVVTQVRKRATGSTVISSDDLRTLVGFESEKRKMGCQEMACLAEIGGALGADQIVIGTLAKLGQSYILDLRLIDARHAKVLLEANERLRGEGEEALLDAAAIAVATIFPAAAAPGPASTLPETLQPAPAPALAALPAQVETKSEPSHPRPLAWALGGVGIAAGGLAVVGLVEMLSFKGWQSQPPGTNIPIATLQSQVSSANTWATVALVSAIAAAAGLTGAAVAW